MTLIQVRVPHPDTKPNGLPRMTGEWRPETDVNDSLLALAAKLDAADPLFLDIAALAATRLLMAGGELDVIEKRRAAATGTPFRTVALRGHFGAHRIVYTERASRGPQ